MIKRESPAGEGAQAEQIIEREGSIKSITEKTKKVKREKE